MVVALLSLLRPWPPSPLLAPAVILSLFWPLTQDTSVCLPVAPSSVSILCKRIVPSYHLYQNNFSVIFIANSPKISKEIYPCRKHKTWKYSQWATVFVTITFVGSSPFQITIFYGSSRGILKWPYNQHYGLFTLRTRLHSSRMRTARSLTVSPSMLCWGGGVPGLGRLGGVPALGGSGACSGGGIPACTEADPPPPWTEFLTHASENITLPQTSFAGGKKRRHMNSKGIQFPVCIEQWQIFKKNFAFVWCE